jgi:hypothetical protein
MVVSKRRLVLPHHAEGWFKFYVAFRLPFARVLGPAGSDSGQPGTAGGGDAVVCGAVSVWKGRLTGAIG